MTDTTQDATTAPDRDVRGLLLRVAGAGLLVATGGIHLDLYLTGYRHIPTIGPLFLLQVVAAFGLALAVLALASRTIALAGAGFAVSTLGGYILSLWVGLFGFNEVRTTAGIVAGALEVATFIVLGAYAAFGGPRSVDAPERREQLITVGRRALAPLGALAVLALVLAVANSPGTSGTRPAAAPGARGGPGAGTAPGSVKVSVKVSIKNFAFVPATFTVVPGERIVVTNRDSVTHTFTATPGSTPQGHFSSGNIGPDKTVTVLAPTGKGRYAFYCAIHPFMTGTVTVK